MSQQGIYVGPIDISPNRDRTDKQQLYLYVCKYRVDYGNGMVIVAARNPMRAMEIIMNNSPYYKHEDLEQIVGATYKGYEGIINQQQYLE